MCVCIWCGGTVLAPSFSCLNFCTVATAPSCPGMLLSWHHTPEESAVSRTRIHKHTDTHKHTHICTCSPTTQLHTEDNVWKVAEKEDRMEGFKIKWTSSEGGVGTKRSVRRFDWSDLMYDNKQGQPFFCSCHFCIGKIFDLFKSYNYTLILILLISACCLH